MKKSVGPSLHIERRPLARCPECHGAGITTGIFFQMPCGVCSGSGLVDKDTGRALPPEDLVLQLRLRLTRLADENRKLRRMLAEQRESRGCGPMGMVYHGD